MWENIFMLIMQGGLALQHIQTWQRNHKGMQNHVVSKKKKNELKNEGLLFYEYRDIFVDFLKSIQWKHKENLRQSTTYLTTEIWHFLQTFDHHL